MSQFNLRKKEDVYKEKIKYLEQKLERKENVIFKLEVEISKLKFRLLKSQPKLGIIKKTDMVRGGLRTLWLINQDLPKSTKSNQNPPRLTKILVNLG